MVEAVSGAARHTPFRRTGEVWLPAASLSTAGETAPTGPSTQKSSRQTISLACSPFPPAGTSRTRTRPTKCRTGIQPEDSWSYGHPEMGGEWPPPLLVTSGEKPPLTEDDTADRASDS